MIGSETMIRRMALAIIRQALRLLPHTRSEWAQAMLTEFYYLDRDSDALVWAGGCLIASITMRIDAMITGNLKISRWILAPELLFCFVPLTLAWFDGIFGMSGIIRLNMEIIQQYFINSTTGTLVLIMMLALAILGVLGPVALFAACRLIVTGRSLPRNLPAMVLITGPIVLGVIYVTGWLLTGTEIRFDHWGGILLFSILPALGAAHMYYVYSPDRNESIAI